MSISRNVSYPASPNTNNCYNWYNVNNNGSNNNNNTNNANGVAPELCIGGCHKYAKWN